MIGSFLPQIQRIKNIQYYMLCPILDGIGHFMQLNSLFYLVVGFDASKQLSVLLKTKLTAFGDWQIPFNSLF